ncbi:hypothetical protein [uncultured Thiodictyon sp.]|uniref:hypothetical protein n=1 Tax=uncultured Thiodictyon sp. TaxID=1846217 RepID=UPI0025FD9523|nr:hypothetical protein [uncultured Thiodictyon sp.]
MTVSRTRAAATRSRPAKASTSCALAAETTIKAFSRTPRCIASPITTTTTTTIVSTLLLTRY